MQLNHLDLQVTDVQALAAFLVAHFDLVRGSNDRSPAIAILGDGAEFTLVIQRRTDDTPYPAGFHIGFIQPKAATVRAHHARLTASGVAVSPIDVNARGTRFYLTAPGDILIRDQQPRAELTGYAMLASAACPEASTRSTTAGARASTRRLS